MTRAAPVHNPSWRGVGCSFECTQLVIRELASLLADRQSRFYAPVSTVGELK